MSIEESLKNKSKESENEKEQLKLPNESNPHTLQNKNTHFCDDYSRKFRILSEDSPREKYQRRSFKDKTTFHFGQRKLLLSEIEFLTLCTADIVNEFIEKDLVVIYIGAAPGNHTSMLVNMFPYLEYVLVDPAEFKIDNTKHNGKVTIINEIFTDEMAIELKKKYSDKEILFISDIRTADHRKLPNDVTELRVEQDMIDQMRWYYMLEPFKSMFKFRLPYVGNNQKAKTEIEYLDGVNYFQVWEGFTSTETRLIVGRNAQKKLYDCVWYEDTLYRFNTVERVLCYAHDTKAPGIDHCYDCRSEIFILDEYLKQKCVALLCEKKNIILNKDLPQNVTDFIIAINDLLQAHKRITMLTYKQKFYNIRFTDMSAGADISKLFHDSKLVDPFKERGTAQQVGPNDIYEEDSDNNSYDRRNECPCIHSLQNYEESTKQIKQGPFDEQNNRILSDNFPTKEFLHSRRSSDRTCIYYQERSLLLSQIEFLSNVCVKIANEKTLKYKRIVLIYAGAAPRRHINLLHSMFPFMKFLFYDPGNFETNTSPMIEIKREKLDENVCLSLKDEYEDHVRLFISNIKTPRYDAMNSNKIVELEDMNLQMYCWTNLKPFESLLRFRVSFSSQVLNYPSGRLYFNLWDRNDSYESRLVVEQNASRKPYDLMNYRKQMYRFQTVERVQQYELPNDENMKNLSGLDACYDCRAEIYTYELYKSQSNLFSCLYRELVNDNTIILLGRKSVGDLVNLVNETLESHKRRVHIILNNKRYFFYFDQVKYGKKFKDMNFLELSFPGSDAHRNYNKIRKYDDDENENENDLPNKRQLGPSSSGSDAHKNYSKKRKYDDDDDENENDLPNKRQLGPSSSGSSQDLKSRLDFNSKMSKTSYRRGHYPKT